MRDRLERLGSERIPIRVLPGKEMEAVIAIGIFVAVIILLNIVEFGRAD